MNARMVNACEITCSDGKVLISLNGKDWIDATGRNSVIKRVKRLALPGEYVEVTNVAHDVGEYKIGDIIHIVEYSGWAPRGRAYYKDLHASFLVGEEYVVLDGYAPALDTTDLSLLPIEVLEEEMARRMNLASEKFSI